MKRRKILRTKFRTYGGALTDNKLGKKKTRSTRRAALAQCTVATVKCYPVSLFQPFAQVQYGGCTIISFAYPVMNLHTVVIMTSLASVNEVELAASCVLGARGHI